MQQELIVQRGDNQKVGHVQNHFEEQVHHQEHIGRDVKVVKLKTLYFCNPDTSSRGPYQSLLNPCNAINELRQTSLKLFHRYKPYRTLAKKLKAPYKPIIEPLI